MRSVFASAPRENHVTQTNFAQFRREIEQQVRALSEELSQMSAYVQKELQAVDDYLEALNQRDHRIHTRLDRLEAQMQDPTTRY